MALLDLFNERLKDALKRKDAPVAAVIRGVKTRLQLRQAQKGPGTELTDAVVLEEITAYVGQMSKAVAEFEKVGERGVEKAAQARYEIDYLSEFLPKKLTADETETLVKNAITELGLTSQKETGKLVGALMKTHKATLDANLAKSIANRLLPL